MFGKFKKIFEHRERSSAVRVFDSDRPKLVKLQKEIARKLDLVSVSQAQVIRYLLNKK